MTLPAIDAYILGTKGAAGGGRNPLWAAPSAPRPLENQILIVGKVNQKERSIRLLVVWTPQFLL